MIFIYIIIVSYKIIYLPNADRMIIVEGFERMSSYALRDGLVGVGLLFKHKHVGLDSLMPTHA